MPVPRAGGHDSALDEAVQVPVLVVHQHLQVIFAALYLQHVAKFQRQVVVPVHRKQDLIVAAVNEGLREAAKESEEAMSRITGGMNTGLGGFGF